MLSKMQIFTIGLFTAALATSGNVGAQADVGVTPIPMINYQLIGQSIAGYGATNINYEFFRPNLIDEFQTNSNGVTISAKYTSGVQEGYFGLLRENLQGDRIIPLIAAQLSLGFNSYDIWGSFHRLYDEKTKIKMYFGTLSDPIGTLEDLLIKSDLFSYSGGVGLTAGRLVSFKVGIEYLSYTANTFLVNPFSETDLDGSRLIATLELGEDSPSILFYGGERVTLEGFMKSSFFFTVAPTPMEVVIPEYLGFAIRFPMLERVTIGVGATYVNYDSIPQFRLQSKLSVQSNLAIEVIEDQTSVSLGFSHFPDIREPLEIDFFNFGDISTLSFGLDWRQDWLGIGLTYVNSSWLSEYDPLTDRLLLTLSTGSVF